MKLAENGTQPLPSAPQFSVDQQRLEPPVASVVSRADTTSAPNESVSWASGLDAPGAIDTLRREMAAHDCSEAIDLAVERLGAQRQVSGAAIALQGETAMMCVASCGAAPAVGAPLELKTGLSADRIWACKPIYCEDAAANAKPGPAACEIRSVLIVPIFSNRRVIGLVEVFSADPRNFSNEQRAIIQEVAALVADTVRAQRETSCGENPTGKQEGGMDVRTQVEAAPSTRSFSYANSSNATN